MLYLYYTWCFPYEAQYWADLDVEVFLSSAKASKYPLTEVLPRTTLWCVVVRGKPILCVHHILISAVLTKLICNSFQRLLWPVKGVSTVQISFMLSICASSTLFIYCYSNFLRLIIVTTWENLSHCQTTHSRQTHLRMLERAPNTARNSLSEEAVERKVTTLLNSSRLSWGYGQPCWRDSSWSVLRRQAPSAWTCNSICVWTTHHYSIKKWFSVP